VYSFPTSDIQANLNYLLAHSPTILTHCGCVVSACQNKGFVLEHHLRELLSRISEIEPIIEEIDYDSKADFMKFFEQLTRLYALFFKNRPKKQRNSLDDFREIIKPTKDFCHAFQHVLYSINLRNHRLSDEIKWDKITNEIFTHFMDLRNGEQNCWTPLNDDYLILECRKSK
jgi:hypothetical protein